SQAMSETKNAERPVLRPRANWRTTVLAGVSLAVCLVMVLSYFLIPPRDNDGREFNPEEGLLDNIPQEDLAEAIAETDGLDHGWRTADWERKRHVISC